MANFNVENRDMSFDEVSEGFSKQGLEGYVDYLKLKVVDVVTNELRTVNDINSAIDKGWQGKSRDLFLQKFDKLIEQTCEEIEAEFGNLVSRMSELAQNYYEQDAKMLEDII